MMSSSAVSPETRNVNTVKKLEKKSGRRASRKRQRMERLLEEVAPERRGSGLLTAAPPSSGDADRSITVPTSSCDTDVAGTGQTCSGVGNSKVSGTSNPHVPVANDIPAEPNPNLPNDRRTSDTPFNNNDRQVSVQTAESRSAARRRRRMRRIKQELQQQVAADSRAKKPKSVSATGEIQSSKRKPSNHHDAAKDAADAVRQIAESPKDNSDPTARSMVAIAGAVTALASAIQFRLTDSPETKSSDRKSSDTKQTDAEQKQAEQICTGSDGGTSAEPSQTSQPSGTSSRNNKSLTTASPTTESPTGPSPTTAFPTTKAKATTAAVQTAVASIVQESPAQQQQADIDCGFEESFFDDDESDVAGAYTVLPPTQQPVERYRDWFQRVVVRNKWATWFTAFYVHWLIILAMMMIFVHGPDQAANLLLTAAFADTPEIETESFDMAVAEPVATPEATQESPPSEPAAETTTVDQMAEESVAISDAILSQLGDQEAEVSGEVATTDQTGEASVQPPSTPQRSVSEGSFSVWTDPEYPDAGEPYRIIVQIQLPPNTKSYHLRDLTGVVVGSDGYRKPIPGSNPGPLPIVDGCVRLVIPIVSADAQVKDTIFIRSKLLKETQKLLIEF